MANCISSKKTNDKVYLLWQYDNEEPDEKNLVGVFRTFEQAVLNEGKYARDGHTYRSIDIRRYDE